MADADASRTVRFGAFEVDLRAGELRKNGIKIKLQEQPFRVLVTLLEHAGDVVTREELRRELWPTDTFVDFEHGLNAAVKRLRDALGESAKSRYSWKLWRVVAIALLLPWSSRVRRPWHHLAPGWGEERKGYEHRV
jgi:DNA-binding response OmpR family regulator